MATGLSRVVLIDDDPATNYLHSRVIGDLHPDTEIVVFEDAEEALNAFASGSLRAELVFLDINMPGMDGWQFLEGYRALAPHLRTAVVVAMLTTSDNPDDQERAESTGMVSQYCRKPLTKDVYLAVLDRISGGAVSEMR